MSFKPNLIWDVKATLGEGPVWADEALWFVDIKQQRVHRFDPTSRATHTWDAPEQIGFVLPAEGGGFLAGLQSGLHRFDPDRGGFELIAAVEPELPDNRLNDGVVDPSGRLWFGTMDNGERTKSGAFYCFHRGRLTRTPLTGIAITNGPAVSPDGSTLYWVDTISGTMWACPIDHDGCLGESRLVVRIPPIEGHPDGPAVDSEGCIWISLYGGWEARRYTPDGELLSRVRFPVANITKLAFGGPDRRTAYATTARHLLSPDALAAQPLAGGLFAFDADVPGVSGSRIAF